MKVAYFDCFSGLSGEMMLGALLAAGLPLDAFRMGVARLALPGWQLVVGTTLRKNVQSTLVRVSGRNQAEANSSARPAPGEQDQSRRTYSLVQVEQAIEASGLTDLIKRTSLAVLRRMNQAETAVYGSDAALKAGRYGPDAPVIITGVVLGLSLLGIDRVECSPVHIGGGMKQDAARPGPALSPVAAEILRAESVPVYGGTMGDELVTPLGAALIATLASSFGPVPAMKIDVVGYGAGPQDLPESCGLLRVLVGEAIAQELPARPAEAQPAASEFDARPFVSSPEEWVAATIRGHQQSGRQRPAC